MQVCTSPKTTTPAPHHSCFYRPDALPAAQPTDSKHCRQNCTVTGSKCRNIAKQRKHIIVIIRYDMIQDAVLMCNQNLTRVSLIYRTEPTTEKCKNRKLKTKEGVHSEVSVNSPGNPWSQPGRRKGRLRWEGFAEKKRRF